MKLNWLMGLIVASAVLGFGISAQAKASPSSEYVDIQIAEAGCTFATLSDEDKRRYQSRYRRRVRVDGQVYADNWLREQVCPSPNQERKRPRILNKYGKPCAKIRTEMRPITSGGSMTMIPVGRCLD